MKLFELCHCINEFLRDKDLINPDVYIRIGESKVPLHVIRIVYKDDSIILQNKSYKDTL